MRSIREIVGIPRPVDDNSFEEKVIQVLKKLVAAMILATLKRFLAEKITNECYQSKRIFKN